MHCEVRNTAAKFGVLVFPSGCENADRMNSATWSNQLADYQVHYSSS